VGGAAGATEARPGTRLAVSTGMTATPPRVLRHTRAVCPHCHVELPATVVDRDGEVRLERECPTHGLVAAHIAGDVAYWEALDRFYFRVNDESWPQRDYIVRMTERCNLACPICLAKANTEPTPDLPLDRLREVLRERRGIKVDLMAAEPTLREDLETWVRTVKAEGGIAALHTNGLRLADLEYARALKAAGVDEVFLQFDGLDDAANTALRGRPLLKARQATLKNLREVGLATSLIVVIARGLNEPQVSETLRFALRPENDHIREVFFLGLRLLGSARHSGDWGDQALMPDDLVELLCAQDHRFSRKDIQNFNLLYFSMLSAFHVKKCLYVQHYLVTREADGDFRPIADLLDLEHLADAAQRYAERRGAHPLLARAGLAGQLLREGLRPEARALIPDLVRLEQLFATGMNLHDVPRRFLLLGFITACDEWNFDAGVAVNCGKGELSADGGLHASSAEANVEREARFATGGREPGRPSLFRPRAKTPVA